MKQKLIDTLTQNGWELNNRGNLVKESGGKKYRIKFQANSVRYEIQVTHEATAYSAQEKAWVRLAGAYYKDVKICPAHAMRNGNEPVLVDRVIIGGVKLNGAITPRPAAGV